MTLREKMVIYRAKYRLTQAELAEKCGLSTLTINLVETGKQAPSKVTYAKIALVVGGVEDENIGK